MRKTGIASSIFLFESALLILSTEEPRGGSSEVSRALLSLGCGMVSWGSGEESCIGFCDSGITQSSNKQTTIAIIDKPHEIQGEMSVVTAAVKEPTSSAT